MQAQEINKYIHALVSTTRNIDENLYQNNLDIGIDLQEKKGGSIGGEISFYKFWDRAEYSSMGIGLRPVMQIFFVNRHAYKIFTEAKGGVIYMLPEHTNNAWNFTFVCGFGAELLSVKNNMLRLHIIYTHFSNGKPGADAANPTWDGFGISLGWAYHLNQKPYNDQYQQKH